MTEDRSTWPALYASGASLIRIASAAGVSLEVVRAELVARGVAIRHGGNRVSGVWRPHKHPTKPSVKP